MVQNKGMRMEQIVIIIEDKRINKHKKTRTHRRKLFKNNRIINALTIDNYIVNF